MTYDTNGIQRRFFSRNPHLSARISILLVLLFFMAFSALSLEAASLVYDPGGGQLTGFWMGRNDRLLYGSNEQTGYHGSTKQVWDNTEGYVGRLL